MSEAAIVLQEAMGTLRYVRDHIHLLEVDADTRATIQIVADASEELRDKVAAVVPSRVES